MIEEWRQWFEQRTGIDLSEQWIVCAYSAGAANTLNELQQNWVTVQ